MGNVDDMPPDETINLPIEKLELIKKLVLASEGWLLNIPQDRLRNDGRDFEPGQVIHTPPAISVNHPINVTDDQ
jgi:HAMP domain-containing protein